MNKGDKKRENARDRRGRRENRMDRKRLRERQHGLQEAGRVAERGGEVGAGREEEGGGEESASTSRWFVFSLFPRGLLINYCD